MPKTYGFYHFILMGGYKGCWRFFLLTEEILIEEKGVVLNENVILLGYQKAKEPTEKRYRNIVIWL